MPNNQSNTFLNQSNMSSNQLKPYQSTNNQSNHYTNHMSNQLPTLQPMHNPLPMHNPQAFNQLAAMSDLLNRLSNQLKDPINPPPTILTNHQELLKKTQIY